MTRSLVQPEMPLICDTNWYRRIALVSKLYRSTLALPDTCAAPLLFCPVLQWSKTTTVDHVVTALA